MTASQQMNSGQSWLAVCNTLITCTLAFPWFWYSLICEDYKLDPQAVAFVSGKQYFCGDIAWQAKMREERGWSVPYTLQSASHSQPFQRVCPFRRCRPLMDLRDSFRNSLDKKRNICIGTNMFCYNQTVASLRRLSTFCAGWHCQKYLLLSFPYVYKKRNAHFTYPYYLVRFLPSS